MAELKGKLEVEVKEMTNVKGMTTCKICGRDFPLLIEDRYVARDIVKSGVVPTLVGEKESSLYDAFDCPHCGCQNLIQERKRKLVGDFDFEDTDLGDEKVSDNEQ